jgi:hypothetical protein
MPKINAFYPFLLEVGVVSVSRWGNHFVLSTNSNALWPKHLREMSKIHHSDFSRVDEKILSIQ